MKYTGIVRSVDHLCRIVLPMELRRTRDIEPGDPIEIYTEGETICLEAAKAPARECSLCGPDNHLIEVDGATICLVCARKVVSAVTEV